MKRRLINIVAVASLMLCLATVALWVRSYWIYDSIEWMSDYRQRFVACRGGRVLLQVNHGPSGSDKSEPLTRDSYTMTVRDTRDMGRPWRFGGFWVENLSFAPSPSHPAWLPYTDIVVPLYAVVILSLVMPGIALRGMIRRRSSGAIAPTGDAVEPRRAGSSGTNMPPASAAA